MNGDLTSLVSSANSILIVLPDKPTFDETAAAASFYLSLRAVKDTGIFCLNPMTVEFNRLIGVDKISSELGNKNLTITFDGYPAENIERVSADVDGAEFKLTVIPKTGFVAPAKNQVNLGFSGMAADLVILTGGDSLSRFSVVGSPDLAGARLVHVGTESLTPVPGREIFALIQPASSVSEAAAAVLKSGGFLLDADIATNLIAGIEEGSDHFGKEGTSAETFDVFARLLRAGGQRGQKAGFVKKVIAPVRSVPAAPPDAGDAPKDWFEPKIYKGTSVS